MPETAFLRAIKLSQKLADEMNSRSTSAKLAKMLDPKMAHKDDNPPVQAHSALATTAPCTCGGGHITTLLRKGDGPYIPVCDQCINDVALALK